MVDLETMVNDFAALGYVNDAGFAEARSRSFVRRGYGARRLAQDLSAAGIVENDSADAIKEAEEGAWKAAENFARRKRIGPFAVPKAMSSTASATLATWFKIHGVNYSISSACSTSAHCIGNAMEMIQWGKQDRVFAGGHEDLDWSMSNLFDAMGAMSSKHNETPATASRAYDMTRDGFVIAGGAAVLVLEALDVALARGAKIYAEIVGYGATSDGYDMVAPSGEGAVRCMRQAMATIGGRKVDYINTHGTSTPVGDSKEMGAIREVFGSDMPHIQSTKSLTGHSLGAAGAQEAIYSLLMMQNNFIGESAHITELDPEFEGMPIVRKRMENKQINVAMSNSFGFGGTNATLAFARFEQ